MESFEKLSEGKKVRVSLNQGMANYTSKGNTSNTSKGNTQIKSEFVYDNCPWDYKCLLIIICTSSLEKRLILAIHRG